MNKVHMLDSLSVDFVSTLTPGITVDPFLSSLLPRSIPPASAWIVRQRYSHRVKEMQFVDFDFYSAIHIYRWQVYSRVSFYSTAACACLLHNISERWCNGRSRVLDATQRSIQFHTSK